VFPEPKLDAFVYTGCSRRKVNTLVGHGIGHSKHKSVYVHVSYSEIELLHCTDEQHAMPSHELQSALMLTAEFSKMYYTM
jgi:hypothetical protein